MIKSLAKNKTELHKQDRIILYSYSTPVAVYIKDIGYFISNFHHSKTTSRHVNSWISTFPGVPRKYVTQEEINRLSH